MEIITKPLKDLDIAHYNSRKNLGPNDPEYQKLKKSIAEFGVVDPIVWNKRTGRVVGGHQRLKVLKEMGITETEVSVVDLDDQKEKALNLALNKISGEWDMPKLKNILVNLKILELDIDITGFEAAEIDNILGIKKQVVEDEVPEPPKEPITKLGVLWVLGKHRVMCGDCSNPDNYQNMFKAQKPTMFGVLVFPASGQLAASSTEYSSSQPTDALLGSINLPAHRKSPFMSFQITSTSKTYNPD